MYRQHRIELYSLGDVSAATLYVAAAVAALTLTATSRLWETAAGEIAWFVSDRRRRVRRVRGLLVRPEVLTRRRTGRAVSREQRELIADWLVIVGAVGRCSRRCSWRGATSSRGPSWPSGAPRPSSEAFRTTRPHGRCTRRPTCSWRCWRRRWSRSRCAAGRRVRLVALLAAAVALAFTIHALSVPPTNGADDLRPAPTCAPIRPSIRGGGGRGDRGDRLALSLAMPGSACRSRRTGGCRRSGAAPDPVAPPILEQRCRSPQPTAAASSRRARRLPVPRRAGQGDLRRQGEVDPQAGRVALLQPEHPRRPGPRRR